MVLVAYPSVPQEKWIARNLSHTGAAVGMGVGAAFDFHAGTLKRAPMWMQKIGLEWFFRFLMDPKRLWKRYLVYNTIFILKIIPEIIRSRFLRNF